MNSRAQPFRYIVTLGIIQSTSPRWSTCSLPPRVLAARGPNPDLHAAGQVWREGCTRAAARTPVSDAEIGAHLRRTQEYRTLPNPGGICQRSPQICQKTATFQRNSATKMAPNRAGNMLQRPSESWPRPAKDVILKLQRLGRSVMFRATSKRRFTQFFWGSAKNCHFAPLSIDGGGLSL